MKKIFYAVAIIDNQPDSIRKYGAGLYPTIPDGITKFFATSEENCMNYTLTGSNVRPVFLPRF